MFRPETHVAQQSRRDKLRVPPPTSPTVAAHQQFYDTSAFPTPLDFATGGAGCSDSQSPQFFNQFDGGGGGGGVWRSSDWVINAPFLAASSQLGDLHFPSLTYSPYSLHEVVSSSSSSSMANQALEMASLVPPTLPPLDGASEMLLMPSYGGNTASVWTNRVAENWGCKGDGGFAPVVAGETTQGLSLSLSSNPSRVAQIEERFAHSARPGCSGGGGGDRGIPGFAVQGIAGGGRQAVGPLGPFTGYSTILKSSKFLKPAQQLLDEFCAAMSGSRIAKHNDVAGKRSVAGRGDDLCSAWAGGNSGASSSSLHSSTEAGGEGSAPRRGGDIHRPEFEHKKAKLLYMQEEVCRRYKHYHQQMQLVVSSFESVAGLSSATPYASLALKAVSKQFRCIRNAISDQLRHVCKVLGDEFMSSSPSSSKNDNTVPKLKFVEPGFRRQKSAEGSLGYSDNHPIWRPQRGLPERAVSVLRAWLFDHFLHPYPTDTDKHMLATQTGLSRNQVSNWFINARVRLWKPMVEEIHMLETRGMAGMDLNSCRNTDRVDAAQAPEGVMSKQLDYAAAAVPMSAESSHCVDQWHQEKKSRLEDCAAMDGGGGGLMSFAYQGGMDIGGLGAVSLTLGLRQGEGSQQHIRHYGHQMLHDFVG